MLIPVLSNVVRRPNPFSWFREVTIDNSGGAAKSDYQATLNLTSGNFDFANAQTNGEDLRFYSTQGRGGLLKHWIESYNSVGETATVKINVPTIPADASSSIYLYYGSSLLGDASDIENTFLLGDNFSRYNPCTYIAGGPKFATDSCQIGTTIYLAVFDSSNGQTWIYKSTDDGSSWSVEVEVLSSGSGRTHPYLDTDGDDTLFISYKISAGGAAFKKYTISTTTLGTEKNITSDALTDPKILYVNSGLLLCFYSLQASPTVRCYESTDDGDTWSLRSTVESGGSHSIEDTDAIVAPNGNILTAWEREQSEKGEASCELRISSDNGATWGDLITIIADAGVDHEGGHFIIKGSTVYYVLSSDKRTGVSYDRNQVYRIPSLDNGATWGSEELIFESFSHVETVGEIDSLGRMLLVTTEQYDGSGTEANFLIRSFHAVESTDTDWSDRGWNSAEGIFAVELIDSEPVCRAEGIVWDGTRPYMPNNLIDQGDYIIECDIRTPNSNIDIRIGFAYQDIDNNYLVIVLATSIQVYKRVGGTYTLLNSQTIAPTINAWHSLKIQMSGSSPTTIKTWFNGTLENNITDSTYSSGEVALAAPVLSNRVPIYFRKYRVSKFDAVDPTLTPGAEQAA